MKKKILVLGIILALVLAVAVPMVVLADSGDTTVTANFESITIIAPTGATNLVLNSTGSNNLVTSNGSVTSTVAYDVTAVDAMNDGKQAGVDGYMVEWTGSAWNNANKIALAVQVGSAMPDYGQSVGFLSNTPRTVIDGAPAGTAVDNQIIVTVITAGETALNPPSVYKIVITFTASVDT